MFLFIYTGCLMEMGVLTYVKYNNYYCFITFVDTYEENVLMHEHSRITIDSCEQREGMKLYYRYLHANTLDYIRKH